MFGLKRQRLWFKTADWDMAQEWHGKRQRLEEKSVEELDDTCSFYDEQKVKDLEKILREQVPCAFEELWISRPCSDLEIHVETKVFHLHRYPLVMQSSVFATMVKSELQKSKMPKVIKLEIKGFKSDAVENFLRSFYVGDIGDEKHALETFALASVYKFTALKSVCCEIIIRNMDKSTALKALAYGNMFESPEMIEKAFEEIKVNCLTIKFPNAYKNHPQKVAELIKLKIMSIVK